MPNSRVDHRHRKRGARASNGGSRPRAPVKSLLPRSQSEPSPRHQETAAQERDEGNTPREEDETMIDNDNQREREEEDEMMLVRQHSCPDSGIGETIGVEIAAGPLVASRSTDALISSGNGVKIREWIEIRPMLYDIAEDAEDEDDETKGSFWTDGTTIGGDGTTTGGGDGTTIGGDAQSLAEDNPAVSDVFSDLSSRHGSALGRSPSDAPSLRSETSAVTLKAGNLRRQSLWLDPPPGSVDTGTADGPGPTKKKASRRRQIYYDSLAATDSVDSYDLQNAFQVFTGFVSNKLRCSRGSSGGGGNGGSGKSGGVGRSEGGKESGSRAADERIGKMVFM